MKELEEIKIPVSGEYIPNESISVDDILGVQPMTGPVGEIFKLKVVKVSWWKRVWNQIKKRFERNPF